MQLQRPARLFFACLFAICATSWRSPAPATAAGIAPRTVKTWVMDTSFGTNGIVPLPTMGAEYANDAVQHVLPQPSGKFVLQLNNGRHVRVNADGSRDMSYGVNGVLDILGGAFAAEGVPISTAFANGSMIATHRDGGNVLFKTYSVDGVLQSSIVTPQLPDEVFHLRLTLATPDGKIVALRQTLATTRSLFIQKYQSAGQLDATFGVSGTVVRNDIGTIVAAKVLTDGRVLIVDDRFSGINGSSDKVARITALRSDGSEDVAYAGGGQVEVSGGWAYYADIANDGRIVIYSTGTTELVRQFSARGELYRETAVPVGSTLARGEFSQVLWSDDSKVILHRRDREFGAAGENVARTLRLLSTGFVDTTFGQSGTLSLTLNLIPDVASLVPAAGGLMFAGYRRNATQSKVVAALAYFTATGQVKSAFGDGGQVVGFERKPIQSYVAGISIRPDGSPLIATGSFQDFDERLDKITALTLTGQIDASFGSAGSTDVANYAGIAAYKSEYAKSYARSGGGFWVLSSTSNGYAIAAYLATGSLDTGFGVSGSLSVTLPITPVKKLSMLAAPSGKLYVFGSSACVGGPDNCSEIWAARHLASGALDAGFGVNGMSHGLACDGTLDRTEYSNGVIQIACENGLQRLLPNGLTDPAFGVAGVVTPAILSTTQYLGSKFSFVGALNVPDGRTYVVLRRTDCGKPGCVIVLTSLMRIDPAGQPDATFVSTVLAGNGRSDLQIVAPCFLENGGGILIVMGQRAARFLATGEPDRSLGFGGAIQLPVEINDHLSSPSAIALLPGGERVIYAVLRRYNADTFDTMLVRLVEREITVYGVALPIVGR